MANNTDTLLGVLTPILEAAAPEDLPLLLASLERLAALKYEAWAEEASDAYEKSGLLDCAARERAIADFLESLDPNSAAKLAALQAQFPNASSLYDSIM
ncbi:MAG: hypothetical protein ACI9UU_003536, partial [Candidatus Azotimanducaceae bacterium]